MMDSQKTYRVAWYIDVDATSAEAAAEQAYEIQHDEVSIATIFLVRALDSDDEVRVDLAGIV
jgi:hypothetical protein